MLIGPTERCIVFSLGWVDDGSIWLLDTTRDEFMSSRLSNAKHLAVHAGARSTRLLDGTQSQAKGWTMASCAYCDSFILFGGVKDADHRFCNAKCAAKGQVLRVASMLPGDLVEKQVRAVHAGNCPKCGGSGPVDVHISHRAMSALVVTQWSSHPLVSCVNCGTKAQLQNAGVTLLLGWWGLPWGLIMTPVQLGKNIYALAKKPDPRQPTPALYRVVSSNMAAQALANQR